MKKNKKLTTFLVGATVVGIYRAVKGKGAFNKIRFSKEHEAISKYIETHYPGAFYSAVEPTGDGWSCVVTYQNREYLLYLTCSDDGVYIFEENEI